MLMALTLVKRSDIIMPLFGLFKCRAAKAGWPGRSARLYPAMTDLFHQNTMQNISKQCILLTWFLIRCIIVVGNFLTAKQIHVITWCAITVIWATMIAQVVEILCKYQSTKLVYVSNFWHCFNGRNFSCFNINIYWHIK